MEARGEARRSKIRRWRQPTGASCSRNLPDGPDTFCEGNMHTVLFPCHLLGSLPFSVSAGINLQSFWHWRKRSQFPWPPGLWVHSLSLRSSTLLLCTSGFCRPCESVPPSMTPGSRLVVWPLLLIPLLHPGSFTVVPFIQLKDYWPCITEAGADSNSLTGRSWVPARVILDYLMCSTS